MSEEEAADSPPSSPFHGFSSREIAARRRKRVMIPMIEDDPERDLESPPESPKKLRAGSPALQPCYGFQEAEFLSPLVIKTESVDGDPDDIQVVEVMRGGSAVNVEAREDDEEVFYGFAASEIPLPMIIKDEPDSEDIIVEKETLAAGDISIPPASGALPSPPKLSTRTSARSPIKTLTNKSPKKATTSDPKTIIESPSKMAVVVTNKSPRAVTSPRISESRAKSTVRDAAKDGQEESHEPTVETGLSASAKSQVVISPLKSPLKIVEAEALKSQSDSLKSPIQPLGSSDKVLSSPVASIRKTVPLSNEALNKEMALPVGSPKKIVPLTQGSPNKGVPVPQGSPVKAALLPKGSPNKTMSLPVRPPSKTVPLPVGSPNETMPLPQGSDSLPKVSPSKIVPLSQGSPNKALSLSPTRVSGKPVSPSKPVLSPTKTIASASPKSSPGKAAPTILLSSSKVVPPVSPIKIGAPASPTKISLAKSPARVVQLNPASPVKPSTTVSTISPTTQVSPQKLPKSPARTVEDALEDALKSPTKMAAESLTFLSTAPVLATTSPAKTMSPTTAAALVPNSPQRQRTPSPTKRQPSILETALSQTFAEESIAMEGEEQVVEEEGVAGVPILPDTTDTVDANQDEGIAESAEVAVEGECVGQSSGSAIIVRNETNRGVFQAQEQQLQDHEPGAKVVGEETEVEGTYEMQESSEVGNVLVLENEENVETTTIEIQDEGGEEDILVMVDGERGQQQLGFDKAEPGEISQQRHSPIKGVAGASQQDLQQITIIETGEDHETVRTVKREEIIPSERLPRNIQILDENGSAILLMDKDSESEADSDMEDREFTVIVDEDASDEEDLNLERIPLEEKNTFEGETIEDILAQFENEQKKAVACPNCKKCFVSAHFLNIHVTNKSTLCDLCNTQCCTATNLRNHKNLDCDLSKRKRNIDLIAQETALLGRKPIEPEKYYNLPPEDSSDEENEGSPRKIVKSVNDVKYECGICGQYVKILNSHMKFIHGVDSRSTGTKFKCPDCGVMVNNLQKHRLYRHDPDNKIVVNDGELEVVRCKNQGCDSFFNNAEELAHHQKHEHADQARLACGMGGCELVFDSRGALRKHRTENHPELEEFKPVDLEPDDPDREAELTVACPVCERKFKHKNTCSVHIKVHHLGWSKRKMYECPDCMKDFDNKKNLELHREAIHLGIRTICPLCEKPVTRLDLHVRMVHTDMPEWPCPDCGKKFKRKFDLNRHRVTVHLGVRNFPCDLCGKRFADMKDMTRHKNAVHYGMKIKWNSKKHKEERKRKKEIMDKKIQQRNAKYGRKPAELVEFVDAEAEEGATLHIEEGSAHSLQQSVILDPVLQEQIANVQNDGGEPRVLIEADPDNNGSLRFVVLQEDMVDENGMQIEEEEETHIILEPED